MHYYAFNIGDYVSHTRHLTLLEDLAYRRLLDLYYLHEQPLSECSTTVARLIGMRDNVDEVAAVLTEFFEHVSGVGYVNPRADDEIVKYKNKQNQRSMAGKASAERRLNARSTNVQLTKNQEPRTNKQEVRRFTPPSISDVADYVNEKKYSVNPASFIDYYESNGWMVGRNKMKDWKAAVRNWASKDFNKPKQQTITETWKNAI